MALFCKRITLTNPVWFIRRLNLWHLRNPNESRNCSEKQARGSWWFSIARLLCCRLLLFSKCSCVLRSITGGKVTTCIPFDAGKSLRCAICDDWDFKEQTWPYWLRYWTSMSSSARPDNVSHSIDTAVSSRDTGLYPVCEWYPELSHSRHCREPFSFKGPHQGPHCASVCLWTYL